ncbi:hypothetical protein [Natrinema amylolyticum]|uniref:hypothetical protein n=1 Tax=Natrinema amylolyticum TaxID=2878679 RepID=UPI001CFBBC6E|nr:hypothetical protein [Natrinema amylolyticum]
MTTNRDHDENADGSDSTNTTLPGAVRGSLERLEDGKVDEAAMLVRHLEIAQQFDDAEARAETPDLLEGGPMLGAHRYLATGDGDDEWIASNHVVAIGFDGDNGR